ncbi:MAG: acyltransferase family protein, partial [Muribaculaceae bacterium]|nr:acyltransferase family protein [Muribaculaceae bacterium]
MTNNEVNILNLIRWLSTLAIVICHFLQGFDNDWAWILNIGVQIFFFLSGFLYGNKRISCTKDFFFNRIIKIYIPYAMWVLISIGILSFVSPESLSLKHITMQFVSLYTLPGLNHLWFMSVIFACYLCIPFVDRSLTKYSHNSLILVVAF